MSDYKYEMQEIAEELAQEQYDTDFYSLRPEIRDKLFNEAMDRWVDKQVSKAESLEDR